MRVHDNNDDDYGTSPVLTETESCSSNICMKVTTFDEMKMAWFVSETCCAASLFRGKQRWKNIDMKKMEKAPRRSNSTRLVHSNDNERRSALRLRERERERERECVRVGEWSSFPENK